MSTPDRTCLTSFEIPDHVLPLLQHAADLGLEKACDFSDWDDVRRSKVLTAARTVDLLYLGTPGAQKVAELADDALLSQEPPVAMPSNIDALQRYAGQLEEIQALIEVRDHALRHTGLPLDAGSQQ